MLQLLPDRHMVRMIMEMFGNRSFTLTTGNGKRSRNDASKTKTNRYPSLTSNFRLQKVCVCWRPNNHACWWRLAGSRRDSEQKYGNRKWIPADLEAKAQHYKNSVGTRKSSTSTTRKLNVSWKSTRTTKSCPFSPSLNTPEHGRPQRVKTGIPAPPPGNWD